MNVTIDQLFNKDRSYFLFNNASQVCRTHKVLLSLFIYIIEYDYYYTFLLMYMSVAGGFDHIKQEKEKKEFRGHKSDIFPV